MTRWGGKDSSAATAASGTVAIESLTQRTPAVLVDELQAVGQRLEVADGGLRLVPTDAEHLRGGVRALGVELVVPAGQLQVERLAVAQAEEDDLACASRARTDAADLVLLVEHREVVGPLEAAARFCLASTYACTSPCHSRWSLVTSVTSADVRRPAHAAEPPEHVARQLEDDEVGLLHARQVGEQRPAEVAADPRLVAGGQHAVRACVEVVDFPLVPVTPRIVHGQRSTNRRISVVTGTLAFVRGQQVRARRRDGGGGDDEVGGREVLLAVLAEAELDRQPVELLHRIRQLVRGIFIGHEHACRALLDEPPRDGDAPAEAAEAGDGDPLVANVGHVPGHAIGRSVRGHVCTYKSGVDSK